MSRDYITAGYSQEELVRLTKTFAYAKVLANNTKMVEHRNLFTHPWLVTSVSNAGTWKDSTELNNWIQAEVKWAQKRLMDAAHKPEGPKAFAQAVESMRNAMQSYFRTQASREAETAAINEQAANILGFSARAAAVAYASSNIALAWIGLLSGPAIIGLNFASKRIILYGAEEATKGFILKKLGVGLTAAFGTKLAESWEEAMSADFAALQATNNAPGLIDDSWKLFFQALNNSTLGKLEAKYAEQVAQVGQKTSDIWGTKVLGDPRLEKMIAERNQMAQAARATEGQIAGYKPQGGSTGMGVLKMSMKAAAWGLTVQSTWDSLVTLNKQWHYKY